MIEIISIDDDYCREASAAYWAEEDEMKLGTHPTQVLERIKTALSETNVNYDNITFLDWHIDGPRVKVSLDNNLFGIFNYSTNKFE